MPVSYMDEYYWCARCGAAAVFTALQQRHAYEVDKRYWLQRRKLCDGCHRESRGVAGQADERSSGSSALDPSQIE